MKEQNQLIIFQNKEIRRIWENEEWWFAVVDIIAILTESVNPSDYWYRLKKREKEASGIELSTNCRKLKILSSDGKKYKTDCSNMEGIFRIIQSVPSPKAEPFKKWLATVGYERIQEIENPELAVQRAREHYKGLGYSDEWIEKRLQSISIRGELTDEWKDRGVEEGLEYAILTSEISKGTFGIKPSQYKKLKGLKRQNLRDHMTNLELIFTMLGEEQAKQETKESDAQGFKTNKLAAIKGGKAAGKALDAFEEETGNKVVSSSNFLGQIKEAIKSRKLKKKEDKKELF